MGDTFAADDDTIITATTQAIVVPVHEGINKQPMLVLAPYRTYCVKCDQMLTYQSMDDIYAHLDIKTGERCYAKNTSILKPCYTGTDAVLFLIKPA